MDSLSLPAAPAPPQPSATEPPHPRLVELERRLARVERRPKDPWDILRAVATLMLPLAIAYGGWKFSEASSRAQIASARQMHEGTIAIANIDARVKQAGLVASFMEALTGNSPERRNLAIKAVLIALPQEGPELVRGLTAGSTDPATARFAAEALDTRREDLVRRLFGGDAQDRIRASEDLLRGWGSRPALVPVLLGASRENASNGNGLHNVLGVLAQMDVRALRAARTEVEPFLAEVERAPVAGDRIRALVRTVRARLGG